MRRRRWTNTRLLPDNCVQYLMRYGTPDKCINLDILFPDASEKSTAYWLDGDKVTTIDPEQLRLILSRTVGDAETRAHLLWGYAQNMNRELRK